MATSSDHPWRLTSGEWKLTILGIIVLFLAHGMALIYVLMQKRRSHPDPKLQSLPAFAERGVSRIALTAYARAEDAQKAKAMGFQRHLPKPMEVTSLLNAIVSLVNS